MSPGQAAAILLSAAAVFASGASAGEPTKAAARKPGPTFEQLAREAEAARSAGRLEEAADRYRRALARKPDWVEGRWSLATLLYDLDRHAEAAPQFAKVIAARPRDGLAVALKALCDFRTKDYDAALSGLQMAHALGVPNPEVDQVAAFHAALLLNRAGNPDAAFEILRAFAEKGRDDPPVIDAFGLFMLRMPRLPEEIPPEQREMIRLAGRGGYHMSRGRRTAVGRLALEELVSRYPAQPNAHYALGAYIAPDDPDGAMEEFRRELRATPDHYPSLLQMALIETKRGRAAEALPMAEQAAQLAPNVPAAHLALGRALLDLGETTRAVQELEQGIALAPESPDLHFALARAYQRAGRADDAERARREFLRLDRARRGPEPAASPAAKPLEAGTPEPGRPS
jgi:tetratricopeptide (TPR) repeat protein